MRVPPIGNFLAVIGNERSQGMVSAFRRVIESYVIHLPCVCLLTPGNGEEVPDMRRSDHAPFWDAGYQAIMLTDTAEYRSPHYHQPSDRLETLNMRFAADVCRAAAGLICEMARIIE